CLPTRGHGCTILAKLAERLALVHAPIFRRVARVGVILTLLCAGLTAGTARAGAPTIRWQEAFDRAGGDDLANAVATEGDHIYVGGTTSDATGGTAFTLRSYAARSGVLLWQDRVSTGSGFQTVLSVASSD